MWQCFTDFRYSCICFLIIKVALFVCFALQSWKLLFTYLLTLGKDVTFPLIIKFKPTYYKI